MRIQILDARNGEIINEFDQYKPRIRILNLDQSGEPRIVIGTGDKDIQRYSEVGARIWACVTVKYSGCSPLAPIFIKGQIYQDLMIKEALTLDRGCQRTPPRQLMKEAMQVCPRSGFYIMAWFHHRRKFPNPQEAMDYLNRAVKIDDPFDLSCDAQKTRVCDLIAGGSYKKGLKDLTEARKKLDPSQREGYDDFKIAQFLIQRTQIILAKRYLGELVKRANDEVLDAAKKLHKSLQGN
jgi:hypothetical protein